LLIVLDLGSKKLYFTAPRAGTRSKTELALLILLCGGQALALSFFFRGGSLKPAAPAIFLLLIISVGHFWGRLASLLIAMVGGLVFAAFLFEPYGSLAVGNAADRIVLLLFALSALAVVCLSRSANGERK
jgi:K+-sensing histidine kinase KdpD